MSNQKLKNIVEGFLFASDKALSVDHILKMFPEGEQPDKADIIVALETLAVDFRSHGVELKTVSSGYRFQVREEYAQWVSRLWDEKPQKYTRALLETLALIVYRQPITRGEIEEIRGVSVSSNIVRTLQEREWVKIVGHRDVPGRPALLASTKKFLDYFNLQSLEDLPPLSEIKDLDAIATELDPEQNAALISAIREMQENQKLALGENSHVVDDDDSQAELSVPPPTSAPVEAEANEADTVESDLVADVSEKGVSERGVSEKGTSVETVSVETITAELDAVLEEEKVLEVVERKIEESIGTVLSESSDFSDDIEKQTSFQKNEQADQNEEGETDEISHSNNENKVGEV